MFLLDKREIHSFRTHIKGMHARIAPLQINNLFDILK